MRTRRRYRRTSIHALLLQLLLAAAFAGAGCAGEIASGSPPPSPAGAADSGVTPASDTYSAWPSYDTGGGVAPGADSSPALPSGSGKLGIVVIDIQQSFVQSAASAITPVLQNAQTIFQLAAQHPEVPFLITYEADKSNGLPAQLAAMQPPHAQDFVKMTYDATGLSTFAAAVTQHGLTHAVVLGAETDVCVMQTVLGLRRMGLTVILHSDAVFSSESNVGPALRRMQQAGVMMANTQQVRSYIDKTAGLPQPSNQPVRVLERMKVAIVLNQLSDAALAQSADANKNAKLARLRELLLISEWFDMPLYSATPGALPMSLQGLTSQPVRSLAELAQNSAITQVVFAGTDQGLAAQVASYGAARVSFLLEDGLVAPSGTTSNALEPLYQQGAVPLTYKSLYYGVTKAVFPDTWPQTWITRDSVFYNKVQPPESLPPIVK
ncbi:MAG: isochorismatase family protein [Myxococcales bacterium]|nr:isochorismatase family protein [Myxococcales bacterium]